MLRSIPGFAFRLTGLILGCVAASIAITAIVFGAIGVHKARTYQPYK